jgi:nuclear-control-of-ATPase protein 2
MLLTWASASWFKNTVQGRSQQKMKQTGLPMRETLRRIERQLILNQTNSNEMGEWSVNSNDDANVLKKRQQQCETQGILLCETHLLRSLAKCIPVRDSMRDRFIEDLRDLENPQLTNQQKIQTIDRMTRFWGFL